MRADHDDLVAAPDLRFEVGARSPVDLEDLPLRRYGGDEWRGLSTAEQRRAMGVDPSEWIEPPPKVLESLSGGGTKEPRIDTARRELIKALQNLPDDATFSIVAYNASVQVWRDRGLAKATRRNKRAARLFVEGLEPVGSTNIFDALAKSLEIAAARGKGKGPGADTIFFLTDGRPTSGQIVDPNQILAEISAGNRMLGVTIHTIGVAREQNAAFLFNLAKLNHGEYASHK